MHKNFHGARQFWRRKLGLLPRRPGGSWGENFFENPLSSAYSAALRWIPFFIHWLRLCRV